MSCIEIGTLRKGACITTGRAGNSACVDIGILKSEEIGILKSEENCIRFPAFTDNMITSSGYDFTVILADDLMISSSYQKDYVRSTDDVYPSVAGVRIVFANDSDLQVAVYAAVLKEDSTRYMEYLIYAAGDYCQGAMFFKQDPIDVTGTSGAIVTLSTSGASHTTL